MKKNALTALIILIITIVFLFVVNDLSNSSDLSGQLSTHKIQEPTD